MRHSANKLLFGMLTILHTLAGAECAAARNPIRGTEAFNPMRDHIITLSSGRKLAYAEYGDPNGVPMFYFHGWPSSRLQGELMDKVGRERGIRVVAPDRPGIGLSEYHPRRCLLDWPSVVTELAAHLGWKKFHVIGVSGGGPYVLACAYAMPEQLLSAGVICGAPPLREVGTKELMWTYRLALWGQRHAPLLLAPGLSVSGQLMRLPPNSPLMRFYMRSLCERDKLAISDPELYRILMSSGRVGVRSGARQLAADGSVYSSDWGIDLGNVRFPIHYWHGGRDKNIPAAMAQRFVARLPSAKLTLLPDDGHYSLPMLCNEQIVAELHRMK
jgi:pimeloyl-ACP methyl ester carboxylesterase